MSTYRIEKANMQKLVETLRPQMVADPSFKRLCEQSMSVTPDCVVIYFERSESADPRLHKAAIELGNLVTGVN